jgi:hypothetical protein
MPLKSLPPSLKSEVSKLAKLTNIQNGLPPTLRAVPLLAIFAGNIISRAVGGANVIEERMLGADENETSLLKAPSAELPEKRIEGEESGKEGSRHIMEKNTGG